MRNGGDNPTGDTWEHGGRGARVGGAAERTRGAYQGLLRFRKYRQFWRYSSMYVPPYISHCPVPGWFCFLAFLQISSRSLRKVVLPCTVLHAHALTCMNTTVKFSWVSIFFTNFYPTISIQLAATGKVAFYKSWAQRNCSGVEVEEGERRETGEGEGRRDGLKS